MRRPRSVPVEVGQELSLDADAFGDGPDVLCRVDDYIVFVAGGIPGERLRVRITSAARKFGRASLLRVERPSPQRAKPRCRHFGRCGGCQLQHVDPDLQRQSRADRLARTLRHTLGRDVPISATLAPKESYGHRTKLALAAGLRREGLVTGMFALRSRELIAIEECPAHDPLGFALGRRASDAANGAGLVPFDVHTGHGELRAIVVRSAPATGQTALTFVMQRTPPPPSLVAELAPHATTIAWNRNDGPPERLLGRRTIVLHGPPRIADRIAGLHLATSPGAFFQTSAFGAGALVEAVRARVPAAPNATVVDLYCGGGLLGLAVADRVGTVIGIEENEVGVEDAIASAKANRFTNTRFVADRVETGITALVRDRVQPGVVLLDPPRAGADPRVLAAIGRELVPKRIVYVSCDPAALGRDAAELESFGYALADVQPVDMFPHTHHVEAIATFDRRVGGTGPTLAAAKRLLDRARFTPPKDRRTVPPLFPTV